MQIETRRMIANLATVTVLAAGTAATVFVGGLMATDAPDNHNGTEMIVTGDNGLTLYADGAVYNAETQTFTTECTSYDLTESESDRGKTLQAHGWYSVAGDGAERMYSPACRTTLGEP